MTLLALGALCGIGAGLYVAALVRADRRVERAHRQSLAQVIQLPTKPIREQRRRS